MSKENIKIWITKYTLSSGKIDEAVAEIDPTYSGMATIREKFQSHLDGKEWHRSREAAVSQVLLNIAAKRSSIAKQIAKLDVLEKKFTADK